MRTLNPSLALASLVGFLTAASCTLITDVDRTKIPTDAGSEAGAPGTGGTTTGGTGGTTTGGTGGTETGGGAGTGGEAGQNPGGNGGESGAATGGTGTGATGGTGGTSGTGGTGGTGPTTPVCDHATGTIILAPMTFFSDKDTFSIGDGINAPVIFEFDLNSDGVTSGHVAIAFDGTEDQFGLAGLITSALADEKTAGKLNVTATFDNAPVVNNGGEGGAAGAAGSGAGGDNSAGAATGPLPTDPAHISLRNDLAGALGNVKILRSKSATIGQGVGNKNFQVTGMNGGNAVACDSAASCTTDDECASNDCGNDKQCAQ